MQQPMKCSKTLLMIDGALRAVERDAVAAVMVAGEVVPPGDHAAGPVARLQVVFGRPAGECQDRRENDLSAGKKGGHAREDAVLDHQVLAVGRVGRTDEHGEVLPGTSSS